MLALALPNTHLRVSNAPVLRPYHSHRTQPFFLGQPVSHWLMLAALVVMWGSSFGLTKIAVATVPAHSVVAMRLVVAACVLIPVVLLLRRRFPVDARSWCFFVCMGFLGNALPYWLITWGQRSVDSGPAGVLMAVMPIATLAFAHFFVKGERINPAKAIGFSLGLFGVITLTGPSALMELSSGGSALLSQLAIVAGAVCYAANTIIARLSPTRDGIVAAAGTTVAANALLVPTHAKGVPEFVFSLDLGSALAIGALGVFSTALAPILYFRIIRLAGPTFLSYINYLIPIWALVVGMLFLGESPSWTALLALGLVVTGIAIAQNGKLSRLGRSVAQQQAHSS